MTKDHLGVALRRLLLSLFILFFSFSSFGADSAKIDEIASSKYWLRLLHYKRNWPYGKLQSQLDGPEFFFSPEGNTDPKAELIATVKAFQSSDLRVGRLKQHPQCAFPERYRYLKSTLELKMTDLECDKFNEFLGRFKGQSVSLIFSSAYPNNPGSMYGHTFLRIKSNQRPDMLDYGISYAASVADDSNGFEFVFLGVTGGYRGMFSMQPYYTKVNEYVNSESRDLWEYDLNLNEEETHRMLAHLWEIETNSWFNYYFFDENCSFQILAALEVAKPGWDLAGPVLFTIPAETIKKLSSIPGAITQIKFRPSSRKKMFQRFETLSSSQKDDFFGLIRFERDPASVSESSPLEAAVAYFQYLKQGKKGKLSESEDKWLKKILFRRSEMPSQDQSPLSEKETVIPEESRPDLGHHPTRVGLSMGYLADGNRNGFDSYFQEFNFKFAYHDLMNNDVGYIPFSHIDFPSVTLRYIDRLSKLNIENVTGFAITSLFPLTFLEKKFSWKLSLDYYSPKDFGCIDCHALRFEPGGGFTFNLFSPKAVVYALLMADIEVGSTFQKGYRFGPKLQLATILNPIQIYKIKGAANLVSDLWQVDRQKVFYELELDQSLSFSQAFEARFGIHYFINSDPNYISQYRDGKFTLNYYF